jgi:hypothetical protein
LLRHNCVKLNKIGIEGKNSCRQVWSESRSPAHETVSQLLFCHSVQVKRDTESSNFSNFWIPAFAGMTILKLFSPIMTQSRMPDQDWRGLAEVINLTVALIYLGKHFP